MNRNYSGKIFTANYNNPYYYNPCYYRCNPCDPYNPCNPCFPYNPCNPCYPYNQQNTAYNPCNPCNPSYPYHSCYPYNNNDMACITTNPCNNYSPPICVNNDCCVVMKNQAYCNPNRTITNVIRDSPCHTILYKLLENNSLPDDGGSLASILSSTSVNYTLLAPTDDAFSEIDVKGSETTLTNTLLYHVINQLVFSSSFTQNAKFTTLYTKTGDSSETQVESERDYCQNIRIKDLEVETIEAKVTCSDIRASNGMVHVINKVLLINETS